MTQHSEQQSEEALPLFRAEAMQEQQDRWLGPILLEHRLTPVYVLSAIVIVMIAVSLLVSMGTYTRKARVNGWLVPEAGLIRVVAPFAGVVTRLHVTEGQAVEKGDPLVVVSAELTNESGGKLGAVVIRSLEERRQVEVRQRTLQASLAEQQQLTAQKRIVNLQAQHVAISKEIAIANEQLRLSRKFLPSKRKLYRDRMIPESTLAEAEEDYLDKSAALERLRQQAVILQRDVEQTESELQAIPLQRDTAFVEIDKRILEIDQELAETKARRGVVMTAPMSGIVSSLQAETGSAAPQSVPLLTIVPKDSKLVAHLYGPSRSVGLVKQGDRANLRYAAFPYQRFGMYSATVTAVSKSALGPAELPPQLSAVSSANAQGEPLYRIVLTLDQQTITDDRQQIILQSGLQLEADIALESRPVYRWLFDPLFAALEPAGR